MDRFRMDKKRLPWWSPSGEERTVATSCSACSHTSRTSLHGLSSEVMVFKQFYIFILISENVITVEALWDDSYKIALPPCTPGKHVSGGTASLILNFCTRMDVIGQLHDLSAFTRCPLKTLGGPQIRCWEPWRRGLLVFPGIEPRFVGHLARDVVTVLTKAMRFCLAFWYTCRSHILYVWNYRNVVMCV
jgi:hypothetical protein